MVLPGVPRDRFDPALLAATDDFAAAVAVAAETGAARMEPSHFLVALARIRGGLTRSLFAGDRIPVDVFVDALRGTTAADPSGEQGPVTECTASTISARTRLAVGLLAGLDADRRIGEREVLGAVLQHLEPAARDLLAEHAGADLAGWERAADAAALAPVALFGADGRLSVEVFTPATRTVLATMTAEASALGRTALSTVLLLHAMATVPHGLVEQAALMLRFDLRELRSRMVLMLRGRTPGRAVVTDLDERSVGGSLRLALERAAAVAAARGARHIGERDLLAGLLDSPAGPVAAVLRAAAVDEAAVTHYAECLYSEPAEPPVPAAESPMSVQESLDWLRANLIGQGDVVDRLVPRVELIKRASRRGFRMGERPLATFLFCGPSGTGKTMTARLIAKVIFGSADDLIVFEMGQFNSRHSINTFIGAPPGYVGFGEGQLTNGLARTPRSVLLFDEVEKAHPLVLDALLRLLDEGRVNDPAGPVRDARDAVVVLTSNLGAKEFAGLGRIRNRDRGPGPDRLQVALQSIVGRPDRAALPWVAEEPDGTQIAAQLRQVLEGFLRPEFLNRIDETILFAPFGARELEAIAVAGLRRRAEQLVAEIGVELSWDADVPGRIVADATRRRIDEAARGVNRCVDDVLHLSLRALDDAEDAGRKVVALRVRAEGGTLAVVADG